MPNENNVNETEKTVDFLTAFEESENQPKNSEAIDSFIKIPERRTISKEAAAKFVGDTSDAEPRKRSAFGLVLKIAIPIIIIAAASLFFWLRMPNDGSSCDKHYNSLKSLVTESKELTADGKLQKYAALESANADFTGFLTLPDGKAYPVASESEKGAGYYTDHLFSGEKNSYGCLNTAVEVEAESDITVIRGNASDSARMLGGTSRFCDEGYLKANPSVLFDSEYETGEWVVFAALNYKGDAPFHIDRVGFLNESVKKEYISKLRAASEVNPDLAIDNADRLLILIANGDGETTVTACRKLRTGEAAAQPIKAESSAASSAASSAQSQAESKAASSQKSSAVSSAASKSPTSSATAAATKPKTNDRRYEQTGLTANMDKTAKVDVSPVVTMVDVTGTTKSQAENILEKTLGLKVSFTEQEFDEEEGTVIAQSVAEGAEISCDVEVKLTVSKGITKGETIVPDLVGNAESNLKAVLSNSNLKVGEITTEKSSLEKGTVLSQSVAEGTTVQVKTKINVTVSDGSIDFKVVKMPKLTGKTEKAAKNAIKKAGLAVGKVTTVTSSKEAGTVVSQECDSGESIEEGTTVSFSISNGSKVNNLTVTNQSPWSVTIGGKKYASGAVIKGDYMDIIPCIIEAEMGSGYHIEALKAQAVAAYCWLINAGSKSGAAPYVPMKTAGDRAISAAKAVNGIKATYGGSTAQTYYYAISAGYSANCKDIWYEDLPYLRAVKSDGDQYADGFETTVTYTAAELKKRVKETYGVSLDGVAKSKWFKVTYDKNNCYAESVSIGGKKTVSGASLRDTLLDYELRSTAYKIKYSGGKFIFTVRGYGHGVGMSQVGANYYAEKGWDYKQILKHYFTGVEIG